MVEAAPATGITRTVMVLIPDGFGDGSTAVPVRKMRLVVTIWPFKGDVMVTVGALVSGWMLVAMFKFNVPTFFAS